jgi:hypothetical protein
MPKYLAFASVIILLFCGGVMPTSAAQEDNHAATVQTEQKFSSSCTSIPEEFESAFQSYPNLLQISQADLDSGIFHPIIVYPHGIDDKRLPVSDCTQKGLQEGLTEGLATKKDIRRAKRRKLVRKVKNILQKNTLLRRLFPMCKMLLEPPRTNPQDYSIGKYDENRIGMYASEHYDNLDNKIDGFGGRRTVHLGIDLGAPAGSPVHAFTDGYLHSVGYNPDYGDYGYVIVIEHFWESINEESEEKRVWALYGHLDKSSVKLRKNKNKNNQPEFIQKGQIIGHVGDCHENGGWKAPHVHFQLSITPPKQPHDMPGASSVEDRKAALLQYPDPRYVLGPLY